KARQLVRLHCEVVLGSRCLLPFHNDNDGQLPLGGLIFHVEALFLASWTKHRRSQRPRCQDNCRWYQERTRALVVLEDVVPGRPKSFESNVPKRTARAMFNVPYGTCIITAHPIVSMEQKVSSRGA
ncbi:hypothetical protein SPRG_20213, partial [Saprolegnia parasitica CBS 223.65]